MYYLMIGQEWESKEHTEKFSTIMEAEDAAVKALETTDLPVYIFEESDGFIKEIFKKTE